MLQVFLKSYIIMGTTTMGNFTMVNYETKTRGVSLIKINVAGYLMGSGWNFG